VPTINAPKQQWKTEKNQDTFDEWRIESGEWRMKL